MRRLLTSRRCSNVAFVTLRRNTSNSPYFDTLDKLWNGSSSAALVTSGDAATETASSAVSNSLAGSWISTAQSALGCDPWLGVLALGFSFRLVTLVFSLYGERAAERMQAVVPLLKPKLDRFHRLRESSREAETHIAATELKAEVKHLYKMNRTSNFKAAAGLLGSPLVLFGFASVSKLCSNTSDIGTSSFFWCAALVWPDPFYILPVVSVGLTLANFEFALKLRDTASSTWMNNIVWTARGAALLSISAVSQMSSGVLLYWVGLSLAGLLQPILLRSVRFRKAFHFPDVKSLRSSPMDPLQARVALKVPMLRDLYDPQLSDLFGKVCSNMW